jgi:hypothetical protein
MYRQIAISPSRVSKDNGRSIGSGVRMGEESRKKRHGVLLTQVAANTGGRECSLDVRMNADKSTAEEHLRHRSPNRLYRRLTSRIAQWSSKRH